VTAEQNRSDQTLLSALPFVDLALFFISSILQLAVGTGVFFRKEKTTPVLIDHRKQMNLF
jgi:hypothetical protein